MNSEDPKILSDHERDNFSGPTIDEDGTVHDQQSLYEERLGTAERAAAANPYRDQRSVMARKISHRRHRLLRRRRHHRGLGAHRHGHALSARHLCHLLPVQHPELHPAPLDYILKKGPIRV